MDMVVACGLGQIGMEGQSGYCFCVDVTLMFSVVVFFLLHDMHDMTTG